MPKPNKLNYTVFKAYGIISFQNCEGNVCEKVVANILSKWCEVNHVLHDCPIGSRRQRSTIDVIARVIDKV